MERIGKKIQERQIGISKIFVFTNKVLSGQRNPSAEMTTLALNAKNLFKISSAPAANITS
jgi:hypothetical protein